jgi:hypothetical protein
MMLAVLTVWIAGGGVTLVAQNVKPAGEWREIPLIHNGKVAPEWSHLGWGSFTVNGESLRTDCDERGMGLLIYTRERLGNCQIRVVYRPKDGKSNAGVYIRLDDGILDQLKRESIAVKRDANGKLSPEMLKKLQETAEAEQGVWYAVHHGFEVQIMDDADAAHRTGAVYGLAKAADLPKAEPGAWRTMVVTLQGTRVTVDINGQRVSSFDSASVQPPAKRRWTEPKLDHKRPDVGYFGLQNHDPGDVVEFKQVSVRTLPGNP